MWQAVLWIFLYGAGVLTGSLVVFYYAVRTAHEHILRSGNVILTMERTARDTEERARRDYEALFLRNIALRKVNVTYATHLPTCGTFDAQPSPCSCGYIAAQQAAGVM